MRLSDAIALGRTLLTPYAGVIEYNGKGCAIGMGLKACGKSANVHDALTDAGWGWTGNFNIPHPMPCGCTRYEVNIGMNHGGSLIAHLFDFHVFGKRDWTLDQLIDWVRSVEPAEATPQTEQAVAESRVHAEVGEKA